MTSAETIGSAIVGALACQRDSYLKTFTSTVISCRQHVVPVSSNSVGKKKRGKKLKKCSGGKNANNDKNCKQSGKNDADQDEAREGKSPLNETPKNLYEVELQDTILFPEGGGQPSDTGYLTVEGKDESGVSTRVVPVSYVKRDGLKAVHITSEPVPVGAKVRMNVDWKRRFDHMQQHTGQHLLSAVLDKRNLPTLGWNMGKMTNYVEIPRKLSEEELGDVSDEVNTLITQGIAVTVEIPPKEDVKKNKMPKDYDLDLGVLRVVHIGSMDSNPCCGTHLSSTSQIKTVILLNEVRGKGTNFRLNFVCGDRVVDFARGTDSIVRSLVGSMTCQEQMLPEKVKNLVKDHKRLQTRESSLMKEIAELKAKELLAELNSGEKSFVWHHRPDGDLNYIFHIFKSMAPLARGTVALLTGETNTPGAVIVFGSHVDAVAAELKKNICSVRGGGKDKFQGKIVCFEKGELDSTLKAFKELKLED